MDVSKMSLEALYARREELMYDIDMYERDLERFPGTSPLGHFYLTMCIKHRRKKLKEVLEEIRVYEKMNKM